MLEITKTLKKFKEGETSNDVSFFIIYNYYILLVDR